MVLKPQSIPKYKAPTGTKHQTALMGSHLPLGFENQKYLHLNHLLVGRSKYGLSILLLPDLGGHFLGFQLDVKQVQL